ncbi:MAG: hypothetical protein RMK80_01470 [Pseudobdellovibrionaceae bacterium]|nr:hypothetical protein [Pseudobdellovibrionaceae bacterium]
MSGTKPEVIYEQKSVFRAIHTCWKEKRRFVISSDLFDRDQACIKSGYSPSLVVDGDINLDKSSPIFVHHCPVSPHWRSEDSSLELGGERPLVGPITVNSDNPQSYDVCYQKYIDRKWIDENMGLVTIKCKREGPKSCQVAAHQLSDKGCDLFEIGCSMNDLKDQNQETTCGYLSSNCFEIPVGDKKMINSKQCLTKTVDFYGQKFCVLNVSKGVSNLNSKRQMRETNEPVGVR